MGLRPYRDTDDPAADQRWRCGSDSAKAEGEPVSESPRISVVVAAYRPGEGLNRVVDSLDAQTLPQDEFETIIIDDGSPDDTFERLQRLAASRPNMRVQRIENSGWPSRPRNVAMDMASGEWLLFMDHDDSLYPDALRRAAEYAAETAADVLSPKESKTSGAWWGMPALRDGNVPNALTDGGIARMLPMVPHKFYRREFLIEHNIRFPEGRRRLWEDIYVNVEAWRHAQVVAVLADTPVYLWHSTGSNNSKTYGPRDVEFWDRLDELFAFIDTTLDGPEYADARRAALLHQWNGRVLSRLSKSLNEATGREAAMGLTRAQDVARRYVPIEWDTELGRFAEARAVLVRAGRVDLLQDLWAIDADTAADVRVTRIAWRDGMLHLEAEARWTDKAGTPVRVVRRGDRLVRALPEYLLAALPHEVVDVTDSLADAAVDLGVRDRTANVTWRIDTSPTASWETLENAAVTPLLQLTAVLDPATAAFGRPLEESVHDVVVSMRWSGAAREAGLKMSLPPAPAMIGARTAVAYRANRGTLALDLSGSLRNVVADGGLTPGRLPGTVQSLTVPLPRVQVFGAEVVPAAVRLASPSGTGPPIDILGAVHSDPDGARLVIGTSARVPSGEYSITFRVGQSTPFLGGRRFARVERGIVTLVDTPKTETSTPEPGPIRRKVAALAARGVRRLKTIRAPFQR